MTFVYNGLTVYHVTAPTLSIVRHTQNSINCVFLGSILTDFDFTADVNYSVVSVGQVLFAIIHRIYANTGLLLALSIRQADLLVKS